MALASEAGHWYDREGNPVYEVPRADGKGMRPATLADARKLNLYPGVTGIINCAAKPGLERGKVIQGILSALTLPKIEGEPLDAFAERAMKDSQEQARKAAEKGTAIHAAIEKYYSRVSEDMDVDMAEKYGFPVADAIYVRFKVSVDAWSAEKSFVSDWGYG